jgi:uncharacterized protein YyaL (SSP411 family)
MKMTNRLSHENSPYLLQHAENPVDWYPWGTEALQIARDENKPIFLSIGYAACHWCHVMAHESFEDVETAAFMNEHFVNIKVDREERPDLDDIYMNAVVAMTGQGGWPMSVFLTPQGKPFYGGTYFPPRRRYNMPSFREVLESVAHTWEQDRQRLLNAGEELTAHLSQGINLDQATASINEDTLGQAAMRLAQSYDWDSGGWGAAPKFPQAMAIEFLLRLAHRKDKFAAEIAEHALEQMAKGGMYDVVGGGFARYSTDERWLVPHFEKMLYDNALLARAYLHGYLVSGNSAFRSVCEHTLDFITRELMDDGKAGDTYQGGFFSSLDADSEGQEGKYYTWTPEEIRQALEDPQDIKWVIQAYGLTEEGNFEGSNVLQRALTDEELAERFALPPGQVAEKLADLHEQLLQVRERRVRPGTDDKVLVSWNALALIAFSEAARYLGRRDYLDIARKNADFLLTELNPQDHLYRSWRKGQARHNAYLEDYAGLILGLLALYQSDPDPYWFNSALQLMEDMIKLYRDPKGGFYDTRLDQENLITRPKNVQDNATPSGNALAAMALLQLSAYTGNGEWRDLAEPMLASIQESALRYPTAFGMWLCAIDFAMGPVHEVALLTPPEHEDLPELIQALWSKFRPRTLAAIADFPPPANAPALLSERPLLNQQPTAYVCQHFVCQRPVNDPQSLLEQLNNQ